ncbi:MAG: M81 family metallopeptidase [Verrucomicrobiales bacterium]|nr:M81 family metallopeptidase [Verrucomicrobiales bacterium]
MNHRAPRVFLAGLFHETHCFVDDRTGPADFEVRRGGELLACAGDSSPLGGVVAYGREAGWEWVPAVDFRAMPSGLVEDEVVETFWAGVAEAWRGEVDAIFLVLHGAMSSVSFPDVEGEILGRIRRLPGAAALPLCGVYDLHANFSPAMAAGADALVAYRENPHTDARESAVRGATLLRRCLETGVRPRMTLRRTGLIWIPSRTGTATEPMASLERLAREIEAADESIWAVNVAAGFAYGDTPDTGVTFQVIGTADAMTTEAALDRLEALAREGDARPPEIVEISLTEALDRLEQQPVEGLTVLVEPSDNIGGGAPGDGTGLMRGLIERGIRDAAICLADAAAVRALAEIPIGGRITLPLGGRGSRLDAGPVTLEVELVSRSDGRFSLEDKNSHLASVAGDSFDMGPSAVVRHGGLTILLTTHKTPPMDLGQWRSQGIDPACLRAIVVKAAVAHRRVYDPIAARSFWVDTPGPCTGRLERLPFQFARLG